MIIGLKLRIAIIIIRIVNVLSIAAFAIFGLLWLNQRLRSEPDTTKRAWYGWTSFISLIVKVVSWIAAFVLGMIVSRINF